MWWADRRPRFRPRRASLAKVAAAVVAAVPIAACQVEPLYGERQTPAGAVRAAPQAALAEVSIESADNRVEQVLRNELVFLFTGGGDPPPSRYGLRILTDVDQETLAVQREGNLPSNVLVTLKSVFILEDLATGRTLFSGTAFQTASYTFSSQRFANVRALRDAEDRAARAVAENIALRLGAYFRARAA